MIGGRTDALSVYLLWMQAGIKSKNSIAPVEPMVRRKAPVHQMYFVPESMFWWTSTSLQHRLNRRFRIKAPVHQTSYVPESLFELISEPLQHRLNRCPYRACTGAMMQAWIQCQNPQRYYLDTERPVEPTLSTSTPSAINFNDMGQNKTCEPKYNSFQLF